MCAANDLQFAEVVHALEEVGLPVEVVGLGGLLHTPEVTDVLALLHVAHDPTRGDHLMRLLSGPVARLGAQVGQLAFRLRQHRLGLRHGNFRIAPFHRHQICPAVTASLPHRQAFHLCGGNGRAYLQC